MIFQKKNGKTILVFKNKIFEGENKMKDKNNIYLIICTLILSSSMLGSAFMICKYIKSLENVLILLS